MEDFCRARRDGAAECFMVDGDEDLLNFSLDGEENEDEEKNNSVLKGSASFFSPNAIISHDDDCSRSPSFPEFVEEELEWLSNKDVFPTVDTCFENFSDNLDIGGLDRQSPLSVLENSSSSSNSNSSGGNGGSTIVSCSVNLQVPTGFPVRARSKRRRRSSSLGDLPGLQCLLGNQLNVTSTKQELALPPLPTLANNGSSIGRRCLHCQANKTPQWRAGPFGPKTLCNACGVRYKSGRLVPEYRPASSPTFSSKVHSNSHRKIMEMRNQKQLGIGGSQ